MLGVYFRELTDFVGDVLGIWFLNLLCHYGYDRLDYQSYCGWFIINSRCIKKKQLPKMPRDLYINKCKLNLCTIILQLEKLNEEFYNM